MTARPDHARALALVEQDLRRRNHVSGHAAAVLLTARRFLENAGVPLGAIAPRHVEAFLAERVAAGVGASTPARELGKLRVFFSVLVAHEVLERSPAAGLRASEPPTAPPLLLSLDAVRRLLQAALVEPPEARRRRPRWTRALALRDRACLELLYGVGLRDSELRAALLVDLDLEDASLLVRAAKRGRWRRLPLPPSSIPHLGAYVRDARPLLLEGRPDPGRLLVTKRGTGLSQATSYAIVQRAASVAGLRAHPHAFRRALATHLVRAGALVTAVQRLLGHASLAVTARYVGVDRDDLRRAVELLEDPAGDEARPRTSSLPCLPCLDDRRPSSA